MFDKREIKFGPKNGINVNVINKSVDGNSSWRTTAERIGLYKKVFEKKKNIFKYLHKILLRNSGVSQGNSPYSIIV